MTSRLHHAALLFVAATASACVPSYVRVEATVPHPARAGVIPAATQLTMRHTGAELEYLVPGGVLVDRAAITSVTNEGLCMEATFWGMPDDTARAEMRSYAFELRLRYDDGSIRTMGPPRVSGTRTWVTWHVPHAATTKSAAEICFPGAVPDAPRVRTMELVAVRDSVELQFAWHLDPETGYSSAALAAGPGFVITPPTGIGPPGSAQQAQAMASAAGSAGSLTAMPYGGEQVPGGHPVDVDALRNLLDARFEALRTCLSESAERDPRILHAQGDLIAEFTVGPSGVGNVQVVQNDFTPAAGICLTQHLGSLPIPADPMRWTGLFRYGVTTRPGGGQ